jgi:hypothetical protein
VRTGKTFYASPHFFMRKNMRKDVMPFSIFVMSAIGNKKNNGHAPEG